MLTSYLKMVLGVAISGTLGVFVKNIPMGSGMVMTTRTFLGGIFLTCYFFLSKREYSREKLRENLAKLLLSGALFGISGLFLFMSYDQVGVSLSSIVYSLNPVFIFIVAVVFLREEFKYKKAIGLGVSVLGLFLVNGFNISSLLRSNLSYGLIAAVLYGLMAIINKKVKGLDSILITIVQLFTASFVVGVFLIFRGEFKFELTSRTGLINLLVVSFLHTGYAMKLYYEGIQNLDSQSVALISYVEALSALVASNLILGEVLSPREVLGAVCIIGGAVVGELVDSKSKKKVDEC